MRISAYQKYQENSFKCDYCEHSYKTEKKLRQHKSRKHEGELLNETDPIDDCCLENSRKVERLEKFVKRLQNKVEELELEQYKMTLNDGTLESIIKRNSMKVSCIDCGFWAQNQSRLNLHIRRDHYFFCQLCRRPVYGNKHFVEHNEMVHEQSDKTLTNEEFEIIKGYESVYDTSVTHGDFMDSPATPRREDWRKKVKASGLFPVSDSDSD